MSKVTSESKTHRPLDGILIDLEDLQGGEVDKVRRQGVEAIVGEGEHFEVAESTRHFWETVKLVL